MEENRVLVVRRRARPQIRHFPNLLGNEDVDRDALRHTRQRRPRLGANDAWRCSTTQTTQRLHHRDSFSHGRDSSLIGSRVLFGVYCFVGAQPFYIFCVLTRGSARRALKKKSVLGLARGGILGRCERRFSEEADRG
jgi:hypothetical protein